VIDTLPLGWALVRWEEGAADIAGRTLWTLAACYVHYGLMVVEGK
jgi:hypothetical protein